MIVQHISKFYSSKLSSESDLLFSFSQLRKHCFVSLSSNFLSFPACVPFVYYCFGAKH